jgi:WD40 repeat protein
VFICYAREQAESCRRLAGLLKEREVDAHGDWELTAGDPNYEQRLRTLLAGSTAFVVLLDAVSVKSEACRQEMEWAVEDQKLLLPIQTQASLDPGGLPREIRLVQWIPPAPLELQAQQVIDSLGMDLRLFDLNARITPRALAWESDLRRSNLISGPLLLEAKRWIARSGIDDRLRPKPPERVRRFVRASVVAQRQRTGAIIALSFLLGLTIAGIAWRAREAAKARDIQTDLSLAANAQIAVSAPVVSDSMLTTAIEAISRPLLAERPVPGMAVGALATALRRTNAILSFDQNANLTAAAISADRRVLLEATKAGAIFLRDTSAWRKMKSLREKGPAASAAALDYKGKLAVAGFEDGSFAVWDAETGTTLLHAKESGHVAFTVIAPDGEDVLIARSQRTIAATPGLIPGWFATAELWSLSARKKLKTFYDINDAVFIPNIGLALGTASGDVVLRGLDGELLNPLSLVVADPFSRQARPRIDTLVLGGPRPILAALRSGQTAETVPLPLGLPAGEPWRQVVARDGELPLIGVFSPDASKLAVAESQGHVVIFSSNGKTIADVSVAASSIVALRFLGGFDDPVLLVATADGSLSAISPDNGLWRPVSLTVTPPQSRLFILSDLGNGRALVVTSYDVRVVQFDSPRDLRESLSTMSWLGADPDKGYPMPRVAENGLLLIPDESGWNLIDPDMNTVKLHRDTKLRSAAFSAQGRFLVTLETGIGLALYDTVSCKQIDSKFVAIPPGDDDIDLVISPDAVDVLVHGGKLAGWWDRKVGRLVDKGFDALLRASYTGFASTNRLAFLRVNSVPLTVDLSGNTPQFLSGAQVKADLLAFSSDPSLVIAPGGESGLRLLDAKGAVAFQSKDWPAPIQIFNAAIAVSPTLIVAGGRNGPGHGPLFAIRVSAPLQVSTLLPEMDELVTAIAAAHSKPSVFATVSRTGAISLWDASTLDQIAVLSPHRHEALEHQLGFTPGGNLIHSDSNGRVELLPGTPQKLLAQAMAQKPSR